MTPWGSTDTVSSSFGDNNFLLIKASLGLLLSSTERPKGCSALTEGR
jgi:hypothetical protein